MDPSERFSRLFDLQPVITSWLPDETLFSLCARYHWISSNHRPDLTCSVLFGHPRQGSSHDLPARVDQFVQRMYGVLGDADEVIHGHTLLPFYLRLRTATEIDNAIAAVRTGGLGGLKARLGILASRLGAAHPLKSCPDCVDHDRRRLKVAYWHRDHQWPGACMCGIHGRPLELRRGKVNSEARFHWLLPDDLQSIPIIDPDAPSPSETLLVRLTTCCQGMGTLPRDFHFNPEALRATYVQRLCDLDLATQAGSIRAAACARFLGGAIRPAGALRGLGALAGRGGELGDDFIRLLRKPRSAAHPLRHMLVVTALFESWDGFMGAYDVQLVGRHADHAALAHPLDDTRFATTASVQRRAVIEALTRGESASAAAKASEVSVATAMAWAASSGQVVQRRPKKLKTDLWTKAVALLRRGTSKDVVASAAGVSIETITRLLRTTPGLQVAWHCVRLERQRRVYRAAWKRTSMRLTRPNASTVRRMQPAAFAWLYRNDRAWLEEFAGTLAKAPRSNNSRVRWDERDAELARRVQVAAAGLAQAGDGTRVRLSRLCDAIPDLKGRLSKLDRLPLTRSALQIATGRH